MPRQQSNGPGGHGDNDDLVLVIYVEQRDC